MNDKPAVCYCNWRLQRGRTNTWLTSSFKSLHGYLLYESSSSIPLALKGYEYEHTTTEPSCGGALLYISKKLHYKPRHDLMIYKVTFLESVLLKFSVRKNQILLLDAFIDILACLLMSLKMTF